MSEKFKILVTGSNGQLGKTLQNKKLFNHNFYFKNKDQLDITKILSIEKTFKQNNYDYCLNFAAYTNVEKAEAENKKPFLINQLGVKNLAEVCSKNNCTLIHISTDYVFDGKKTKPYSENDKTNPLNTYGLSKLKGELEIINNLKKYYIIRTSWLYSVYNKNFYKTILKLSKKQKILKIITDQIGTPTLTNDLIDFIIYIIENDKKKYGIYHFSNEGKTTWFEFASKILFYNNLNNKIEPVTSQDFITKAIRPVYSVLDKNKIKNTFNYFPRNWENALQSIIKKK